MVYDNGSHEVGAALGDLKAGAYATGPNDHFAYDPVQLREIINGWRALGQSYQMSIQDAAAMSSVEGPGDEYASQGHALTANASGEAYANSLIASMDYCHAQEVKYQKVLGDMVGIDEEHHRKLQQSSPLDGGL